MNMLIISIFALSFLLLVSFLALALWLHKTLSGRSEDKNLSSTLLQHEIEALRSQVSESLSRSTEIMNRQIGDISSQVTQNLQATTGQINTRLDNYAQVVQNVSHQLGSLSQATEKIFEATKNIASLEEILKPPKLRGSMGEILLENILREILPSKDFFEFQYRFKQGHTVDAIIRLKDGLIPIDAKFPLDNFRRMIETTDEKERRNARKDFTRDLKKHINDISEKYILPDEGTLNFALMYIPAENVYYETVIRSDQESPSEDIYAYSTKKHVFPVSPNSLYPYLMTLSLGFRGLKIERQAKEILSELIRLQGDLGRFSEDFQLVGSHLSNAQKKFAEAEKRLDRMDQKLAVLKDGSTEDPGPVEPLTLKE